MGGGGHGRRSFSCEIRKSTRAVEMAAGKRQQADCLPTRRRRRANAWEDRGGGGGCSKAGCPSMREHLKYPCRSDGGWADAFQCPRRSSGY
ncbi:hypothetical protein RLV_5027 [Rhizobium leguminosarum bv. viciae]|nr:hypothetical protein RLV_5027 [Rhizobium leguminosarum bv. viciae]